MSRFTCHWLMRAPKMPPRRVKACAGVGALWIASLLLASCASTQTVGSNAARLRDTAGLIDDVKNFGKTLGIEPTEALSRTAQQGPALSMLWLWMQRAGTLALRGPIDIRMAIGFNSEREWLKIEQVYRVDGYSVYYRQGNEFADSRSVATIGFADEPLVRRVKVILHEDLHGDVNFALPWEIEEAIVTPLGSLAAVEYFRQKGEDANWKNAAASVAEERRLSRELVKFVAEAEQIFATAPVDDAKEKVLERLVDYPIYRRQFERQTQGQHAPTALEAKLSHDLAYYRYFDRVASLAEIAPSLGALIADLKTLPPEAGTSVTESFLQNLAARYRQAAN
ncbi:MAG TPA: hypothetical protein VHV54_05620 [Candidatus Binatia bacterium]|nr:hypothetical protein [Candidatus Binatia bacterium]